ncbi:hypothetical protein VPHK367G1_0056 [Vibrio phage K367 g1]
MQLFFTASQIICLTCLFFISLPIILKIHPHNNMCYHG